MNDNSAFFYDAQYETKLMMDIHKFSPDHRGGYVGKPIKKVFVGAHSGQMTLAVAHMGKTSTGFGAKAGSTGFADTKLGFKTSVMGATQSMSIKARTIKCLDPSFISFVQRGKYIYFFRCGHYNPLDEDKDIGESASN